MIFINTLIDFPFLSFLGGMNRDVDQVHDMMDDIAEQQDVAKEISDAISNPVAFGNLYYMLPNLYLVSCLRCSKIYFLMHSRPRLR